MTAWEIVEFIALIQLGADPLVCSTLPACYQDIIVSRCFLQSTAATHKVATNKDRCNSFK
jgi:hypothetical protein